MHGKKTSRHLTFHFRDAVDWVKAWLHLEDRNTVVLHLEAGTGKEAEEKAGEAPEWQDAKSLDKALSDAENAFQAWNKEDRYIPSSDWMPKAEEMRIPLRPLEGLGDGEIRRLGLDPARVEDILNRLQHMREQMDARNDAWVRKAMEEKRGILDGLLTKADPSIHLDDDQRRVILTDEDNVLVIAGAGAGKTTTVAAKIRYLCEYCHVDPSKILVITFTRKAVQELQDRIQRDLQIPCPISTFHSAGNAILRKEDAPHLVADEGKMYWVILDYFRESVLKDEQLTRQLELFFASYFDDPLENRQMKMGELLSRLSMENHATLRSDLGEVEKVCQDRRLRRSVTIQSEVLRSRQEVEIANFLYLHQLDYEYEPLYPHTIPGLKKPYTPDFIIRQGDHECYLEHFGITQDGMNDRWSEKEVARYKKNVNQKIIWHRHFGTRLIYTFSGYRDGRSLQDHLREELEKEGFALTPRPSGEVLQRLLQGDVSRLARRLLNLIQDFIVAFKTDGYTIEDFDRMEKATENVRTRLFLQIARACYVRWEQFLHDHDALDFQDMINRAAKTLSDMERWKQKLDFEYIIVDEYQDISMQRFDLTQALRKVTNARLMAVGDDWQSIYSFSGSDITLFTHFEEKVGPARLLKIESTYRNAQEVIDIAGGFIQRNPTQFRKTLRSPKNIQDPVLIFSYNASDKRSDDARQSGENYRMACAVEMALEQILSYAQKEGKMRDGILQEKILLLGRFNYDGSRLERSGLFEYRKRGDSLTWVKHPEVSITFMTAHASKGLGYDEVVVINGRSGPYGFPSRILDDPVMGFVRRQDRSMDVAEERRLFYVAMTRTKNRVFFVAPEQNPSEFLQEIRRDYPLVRLEGKLQETVQSPLSQKLCPICGYPLQLRFKQAFGLRLYMCTNEPEVCDFMTNDLSGGGMSIRKCPSCPDGFLIVRQGASGPFLGCTNWRPDGKGCGCTVSRTQYLKTEAGPKPDMLERAAEREAEAEAPPVLPERVSAPAEDVYTPSVKPVFYGEMDLEFTIWQILRTVEEMSRKKFFSRTVLCDVLQGKPGKIARKWKLQEIPQWGCMKGAGEDTLQVLLDWMIGKRLLYVSGNRYPVLHPTYAGQHLTEHVSSRKLQALRRRLEAAAQDSTGTKNEG
ncbi:MAG: UvrD-helicase domain-containing protein [Clostridia bacterium]|nr:UvrD-helicase domain-containing protein [Clostridia bacterium]